MCNDELSCEACEGKYCSKKVPIFSILREEKYKEINEMVLIRKYKKGQIIFFEGDVADKLYIINKGKIKIFKYNKEGKEQILFVLTEGDFIGDLNLLKKGKFKFNAEAIEDLDVCILTKDNFDKILKENPDVTLRILEEAYERVISLQNLVQTLSTKDVEARIAGLLLSFIRDFGTVANDKSVILNIPLSREEIANFIGVTRETISRKLTSMQEEGIIELVGNKKIIIKKLENLEALS